MYKYFRKADLQNLLLIIIVSNLLYFHTYQSSFHLDDLNTIVDRPLTKNIDKFFDNASGVFHNRVFLLYSYALNYSISGLDVFGYHLTNIIIHSILAIVLYFLVKEILISQPFSNSKYQEARLRNNNVIPLLASILFAIHPLQVESITYISSRSTLLVTLFYLGSFFFFIKGIACFLKPGRGIKDKVYFSIYFLSGFLLFLLGLGFKETIITLPLICVFYLFIFHFQRVRQLKRILISASLIIFFLLIHLMGFIMNYEDIEQEMRLNQTTKYSAENIQNTVIKLKEIKKKQHPILHRLYFSEGRPNIFTNTYNIIFSKIRSVYMTGESSFPPDVYFLSEMEIIGLYYLKLLFFPFNQSVFPDFPPFNSNHWKALLVSLFIMASISIYCLSSNLKLISFSLIWYMTTLMPHASFIPLNDLASEHRTYLSNIGFFMAVSVSLASLLFSKRRLAFLSFILVILVFASMLTLKRNYAWQSEISLWEDTVKKAPGHVGSINALGFAYTKKGEMDRAQTIFQQGLKIDPLNYNILNNMALIYRDKGDFDRAEELFKLGALILEDYLVHVNLGYIYLKKALYYKSIKELNKALQLRANSYLAYFYLGNVYNKLKEYQKAIQRFEKSIELNPDFIDSYNNLGVAYWNLEEYEQAYEWFVKAMNKNTEYPAPYKNIGNYFLIKGDKKQAEKFYKRYQEKTK